MISVSPLILPLPKCTCVSEWSYVCAGLFAFPKYEFTQEKDYNLILFTDPTQFNFWNIVGTQTNCRYRVCGTVERLGQQAQLGSN